jgi:hypothetical protein
MKKQNLEIKLTPAARDALDELVDEYRLQILVAAEQSASDYFANEVKEISVSNIFNSVNKSKPVPQPKSIVDRLVDIYQIVGMLITFFGITYVIAFWDKTSSRDIMSNLGVLSILVGFSLNLVAYAYTKSESLRKLFFKRTTTTKYASEDLSLAYIKIWRDLELALRDSVASEMGESNAKLTLSQLIEKLKVKNQLTNRDVLQLKQLVSMRNHLVHETKKVDAAEIYNALAVANKMLQKLKNIKSEAG